MKGKMSRLQRAKQFMPFAALRGFEELLAKVAQHKEDKLVLSDDQTEELNLQLQSIEEGHWVRIVYYTGRYYDEMVGCVEVVYPQKGTIVIAGKTISFSNIKEINDYNASV